MALHVAAISQPSIATLDTIMLSIFAVDVMPQHDFPHSLHTFPAFLHYSNHSCLNMLWQILVLGTAWHTRADTHP